MFLVDWFYGVLASLGLWQKEEKEAKILFLGPDIDEKSSLLHMLKDEHQPTQYPPISEEFSIGNIKFKAFDLGGRQVARRVLNDYYARVDAVVYLVDANEHAGFLDWESIREVFELLSVNSLLNVPFLILGKVDENENENGIPAACIEDIRFSFEQLINGRPLKVFAYSIVRRMGYREGFSWLSQHIILIENRNRIGKRTMFLVDWFYGVLASLGLWQKEEKEAKILFLGPDIDEKSSLLHMLKDEHQPTQYPPISEEFSIGNIKFKAFDLGGRQVARRVLNDYYARVDAVVYLVDANERARFLESIREVFELLSVNSLANVPFLILGKVDENENGISAANIKYIRSSFMDHINFRPLKVFAYSIVCGMGYREGFSWLSQYIK